LAQLHSQAVDFNKSGVPAVMPHNLRPRSWPHFMEKRYAKSQYRSEKILGQLYDMVKLVDFVPDYSAPFDQRVLCAHDVSEEMLQQAAEIKEQYDVDIRRIMAQHDIGTEFEVWTTFVMSHNGEKRDYSFAEELGLIIASIKGKYRDICIKKAGGDFFETLQPFVTAMYKVTGSQMQNALEECQMTKLVGGIEIPVRNMNSKDMPLMSFPWLFDRELGKIASGNFFSRESVIRQQGMQKRTTKRAHDAGLDIANTIETAEGFVPKGELIDFFHNDKDAENAVAAPVRLGEDTEQARRIEAAIEGRRNDPGYTKTSARLTKEIPDNYENLLIEIDESEEAEEPLTPDGGEESSTNLGTQDADLTMENGDENALVEVKFNLGPKTSAYNKLAALMADDDDLDEE
jgi:RNA-dependent RNA polymerase